MTDTVTKATPEQELSYAIHEALELADDIRRDPHGPQPRSLARLRGKGVSTVKSWMYTVREVERIKHGDTPTILAMHIINYFEQAVPKIEADNYQGEMGLRVDAVIDAMNDSTERLKSALQAIDDERKRKQEEQEKRFPRNRKRGRTIERRAALVADLYDVADFLDIEHDGDVSPDDFGIRKLLEAVLNKETAAGHEDNAKHVETTLKYITATPPRYQRAWASLYDVGQFYENQQEKQDVTG
jgi:hypothetical protein